MLARVCRELDRANHAFWRCYKSGRSLLLPARKPLGAWQDLMAFAACLRRGLGSGNSRLRR